MRIQSPCNRHESATSRRDFLARWGLGFGTLPLLHLLDREQALGAISDAVNPLAAKPPHFPAKATNVILIFLQGGASHVDTFDPKPELIRLDGQKLPDSFKSDDLKLQFIKAGEAKLMGSSFPFRRYGRSGLEISDLFQNLGGVADDLAVIRSCYHDSFIHGPAINLIYGGSIRVGFPSLGSWVLYGLGSESDELPAFMVLMDGGVSGRNRKTFASGFLPAIYQGTMVRTEGSPIMNLAPQQEVDGEEQRLMLDQLAAWNRRHEETRPGDSRLAARIANYELAFRMQVAAPKLFDLAAETAATKTMYGLDEERTEKFGRMCLLARRMVERDVRFVQLVASDWDGHSECAKNHSDNAAEIDKPIAGLITDLKQRGMLENTLVICTGEFGRTPVMQGKMGRDHHPYGYSAWMAGGGIRGGKVIGATDEFGFRAVEDKVHIHDFHATILELLGLDHEKLTFFFQGRDFRLTDVEGYHSIAKRLLAA